MNFEQNGKGWKQFAVAAVEFVGTGSLYDVDFEFDLDYAGLSTAQRE